MLWQQGEEMTATLPLCCHSASASAWSPFLALQLRWQWSRGEEFAPGQQHESITFQQISLPVDLGKPKYWG